MSEKDVPAVNQASYWHARVFEETDAALASDDPLVAAIHVELATHCLKLAQQEKSAGAPATEPV